MVEVPKYYELTMPTLEALKALGGSARIQEIDDKIAELENYPDDLVEWVNPKGVVQFPYNTAWARTWLKNIGMVENSARGVWRITEKGATATKEEVDEGVKASRQKYHQERGETVRQADTATETEEAPPELSEDDWKEKLLGILQNMDPSAFERLTRRVLLEAGFTEVEVTGRVGDRGIDGKGILRVNLLSFRVYFQCKRYTGAVSSSAIRDFRGAMDTSADKALFITTGNFTSEARKEAAPVGKNMIDLIDGEAFCDLLKEYQIGLTSEQVERVTIDADYFAKI